MKKSKEKALRKPNKLVVQDTTAKIPSIKVGKSKHWVAADGKANTTILKKPSEEYEEVNKELVQDNEEKQSSIECIMAMNGKSGEEISLKKSCDEETPSTKMSLQIDPMQIYRKHGLLPIEKKSKLHDFCAMNRKFKVAEKCAELKRKVAKLFNKVTCTRAVIAENHKQILYTTELKRELICLQKKNYDLSKQYENVVKLNTKENIDTGNILTSEIANKEKMLENKLKDKNILLERHKKTLEELGEIQEMYQKNEEIGNSFKKQKELLEKSIERIYQEMESMEKRCQKEIDDLLMPWKETCLKNEQKISEEQAILEKIQQENVEIKMNNDELSESIKEIMAEVGKESDENHQLLMKLESQVNTRLEIDDHINKQEEELQNLLRRKNTLEADVEHNKQILDVLNSKRSKCREQCCSLQQEIKRDEESQSGLEVRLCQSKEEIAQLMRENMRLTKLKQELHENTKAKDKIIQDLEHFEQKLKCETPALTENTNWIKYMNTIVKSELIKKRQKLEELLTSVKDQEMEIRHTDNLENEEKENKRLLKQIEILERTVVAQYREVVDFIDTREFLIVQYKELEEKVDITKRCKEKQESQIGLLEDKLENELLKNKNLKHNRNQLETHVARVQQDFDSMRVDGTNIEDENKKISEKIAFVEFAIEEERTEASLQKHTKQELAKQNDIVGQKLEEIKKIEEEKSRIEAENRELEQHVEEMKVNYASLQECSGVLLTIIESFKQKLF